MQDRSAFSSLGYFFRFNSLYFVTTEP